MSDNEVITRYAESHTDIDSQLKSAINEAKSKESHLVKLEYVSHNVCPIPNPSSNYNREFVISVVFNRVYLY
nr:MAG TPA: hypothetical protein [Caudoviricetes sp.]